MLHFKDAAYRVKAFLHDMSLERGEKITGGVIIKLRLTHQTIADSTGLTRETVTRVVDRWKNDDLISIDDNRHIVIADTFFKENVDL